MTVRSTLTVPFAGGVCAVACREGADPVAVPLPPDDALVPSPGDPPPSEEQPAVSRSAVTARAADTTRRCTIRSFRRAGSTFHTPLTPPRFPITTHRRTIEPSGREKLTPHPRSPQSQDPNAPGNPATSARSSPSTAPPPPRRSPSPSAPAWCPVPPPRVLLGQYPRQGDLGRGHLRAVAAGDAAQSGDDGLVGGGHLGGEAGVAGADVVRFEALAGSEGAGEESRCRGASRPGSRRLGTYTTGATRPGPPGTTPRAPPVPPPPGTPAVRAGVGGSFRRGGARRGGGRSGRLPRTCPTPVLFRPVRGPPSLPRSPRRGPRGRRGGVGRGRSRLSGGGAVTRRTRV